MFHVIVEEKVSDIPMSTRFTENVHPDRYKHEACTVGHKVVLLQLTMKTSVELSCKKFLNILQGQENEPC